MVALSLKLPVPTELIMTGSISLEGKVFALGSVEEKYLNLKVHFVSTFQEIYDIVFAKTLQ